MLQIFHIFGAGAGGGGGNAPSCGRTFLWIAFFVKCGIVENVLPVETTKFQC